MEWAALRAHLNGRQILQDEGGRLMLLLRPGPGAGEAAQRIEVAQAEVVGQPWVALWADVCPAHEIEPRRALVHNATLALGSICIEGDHYYLRHAAPLAGLLEGHLDLIIDLLGHEAARLRSRRVLHRAPERAEQAAGHYAE